jgi:16S rRNA (guanine527-N7)-methyltransferase
MTADRRPDAADGVEGRGPRAPDVDAATLVADRVRALTLTPVSRETETRLDRLVDLLLQWQQRMNLIATSTQPVIWTRHVADSLQLLELAPKAARTWIDLGSGAGFPGLVLACALADVPGTQVHLVESSTKKAAFLREAAQMTGVAAVVHAERIEDFVKHAPAADVVTARALAPLPKLLGLAYPLLKTGAQGLFLKGQDVDAELTAAAKCWNIETRLAESRTDPRSRIVVVTAIGAMR